MQIPICQPDLDGETIELAVESLRKGQISSQGPLVLEFEENFAQMMACENAIAVSNGTTALHLALAGLGIGPGDEVIVPNFTFAATANAVIHCGAKPILADSNPKTWVLDPTQLARHITPKTKAIIPVHLYGQVADINDFLAVIGSKSIAIIEDAAEAHGAKHCGGARVGTAGTSGCFSFFANKLMTTGEGGMVTTNDSELAKKYRLLRDHGMDRSRFYWHDEVGFNYRMTNIQAALGIGQLKALSASIEKRQKIYQIYTEELSGLPISWPQAKEGTQPVCWLSTFSTSKVEQRDPLINYLRERGVDARPGFNALYDMPPFKNLKEDVLPVSDRLAASLVSLPTYTQITQQQQDQVIDLVTSFFKENH